MSQGAVELAVAQVWSVFGRQEGLLSELPADAVWARAQDGEMNACLPRLLELWALNELDDGPPEFEVLDQIARDWDKLAPKEARSIEHLGDTLWQQALLTYPSDPSADELLGGLAHLPLPMVRWLDRWLSSLDGPGALHLADSILRPSNTDAWTAVPDARQQLEAWAASEPIIMGLTVVGGVHLDEGDLGRLLDRLI